MRRIASLLLLIGCAKPQAPSEVTTTAAVASASGSASPTPVVDTRCAPGQLNVPCVFHSNGKCFVRRSNCTGLPCTESAPAEVACDVFTKAREATACDVVRVCRGVSDEGCVVDNGCTPRMPTCIERSCAPRILAATACSAVPSSCIK